MLQLMDLVASEHKFVVDFFLAGDDVSLAIFGRSINTLTVNNFIIFFLC